MMQIMTPRNTRTAQELDEMRQLVHHVSTGDYTLETTLVPKPRAPLALLQRVKEGIERIHYNRRVHNSMRVTPSIVCVVPTYERETDIDKTIESLLLQTRQLDRIVVVVNGPGTRDTAYQRAIPYANAFPCVEVVQLDPEMAGKVNALNWAYRQHVIAGEFDFMLGVDADVVCDSEMVEKLEIDIIENPDAAGVKARYGFELPDRITCRGRGVIYGQRHEFAMTEVKQQLRGCRTEILGGQSTIFRVSALQEAAKTTRGSNPWNPQSKVEDAELTRTVQRNGYTTLTSRHARAWTGLMEHPYEWHKQRRKWQDGHLEDMTRDFRPIQDARRWMQQMVLGWNVLIRVMFVTLMMSGVLLDRYVFSPIWLVPIGLSILQSVLIAIKLPNRSFGEVVRSLLFLPGEIYYLRTLSVWIESVLSLFANIRKDGWKRQYAAEAGRKRAAVSGWIVLTLSVLVP
ncbi:MAG: glycosyltransferase family 2 protein, partial [Candidatus Saccharimonas sp.]